ncbi:hypothetical protein GW915_07040 [bacterium]|nr:hypothetical protein [bacterium]
MKKLTTPSLLKVFLLGACLGASLQSLAASESKQIVSKAQFTRAPAIEEEKPWSELKIREVLNNFMSDPCRTHLSSVSDLNTLLGQPILEQYKKFKSVCIIGKSPQCVTQDCGSRLI